MINRRQFIGCLAVSGFAAAPVFARPSGVFSDSGYAIRGIDPVAYFRKGMPTNGVDAFQLVWHKAVWRFETAANMSAFEHDPHAFAPRYGGHCAMDMAIGILSPTDPNAWAIYHDKLYLTQSIVVRDQWLGDPDRYIAAANTHWRQMFDR